MTYNAALYLRLSRDEAGTAISESIQNQQCFLRGFAEENGIHIVTVLADDGYSGTNFDRPGFKKLLTLIENKEINTVLTKDLSRLGRDYIQTGYYLEQYFPLHNIRYIAVNDGIDTMFGGVGNDLSPFRAVFNDMYAKDISKKVRTALETKKRNGQFIGNRAPYGYIKSEQNKNQLRIDEKTAPVVRDIYQMFLDGDSIRQIAGHLNDRSVLPPCGRVDGFWNESTIRRILTNPTYAGHLTQNRSRKINYKLSKKSLIPKELWITVPNTHAPIVTEEIFAAVQNKIEKRSYISQKRGSHKHFLSGFVFCADCGSRMSFMQSGGRPYLVCSRWRKEPGAKRCSSHCIREDFVEKRVKNEFNLTDFSSQKIDLSALVERITVGLHKEIEIIKRNL